LAATFCVFLHQNFPQLLPKPRPVSLTQVRPSVHTRFLASSCTLNETQKIARLYVPDGVAHGAYTHVGSHPIGHAREMKNTVTFILLIGLIGCSDSEDYKVQFENVDRLTEGDKVILNGLEVGQVKDL